MPKPVVSVRHVRAEDRACWQQMWTGYLAFYNQSLPASVTDATWQRFLDPESTLSALVAEDDTGQAVGFAAYVVHPGTWGPGDVCYLEDLYVAPEARCQGVARKMIRHLIAMGKERSWYRLYWHTDHGNHTARALYDKIGILSDRVKYDVAL
jgi:GNAT superfamily N-acetyltransferase